MHTQNRIFSHKKVPVFELRNSREWLTKLVPLLKNPHYRLATALVGGTFLFFVISLSIFFTSLQATQVGATNAAISTPAVAAVTDEDAPPVDITIARTGLTSLRGAQLVAKDGPVLTVKTAWGSTHFTWVVHTNGTRYETRTFGTRFLDHKGELISLQDLQLGDFVTVTGTLDASAEEPTLHADKVRRLQ